MGSTLPSQGRETGSNPVSRSEKRLLIADEQFSKKI